LERAYFLLAFIILFFSRGVRALLADRHKILHHGQKRVKFGPIFDDFKLWWQMCSEWVKIFKIGQVLDQPQFLPYLAKKVR